MAPAEIPTQNTLAIASLRIEDMSGNNVAVSNAIAAMIGMKKTALNNPRISSGRCHSVLLFFMAAINICSDQFNVQHKYKSHLTRPIHTQGGASGVGVRDAVKLAR